MRNVFRAVACLLLLTGTLRAQAPVAAPPLRVGAGFFGTAYVGDLNTNGTALYRFSPGMNFSLQFASTKFISPQISAGFGRFFGQDRDIPAVDGIQPNTFVETSFFFADFRLKARFFRNKEGASGFATDGRQFGASDYLSQRRFIPYLSAGLGLLGYTPRDQDGNTLLDNTFTRNEAETYGSITASFPLSAGFEYRLSDAVMMGLEYTYRLTASDYLDNIGQLGPRTGKDKLQGLTLNIFITLDPAVLGIN